MRKRMYSQQEFPFFNLENGQIFKTMDGLYGMKIQPLDLRGREYEVSCNYVLLHNGRIGNMSDYEKVMLVTGIDICKCLEHQCDLYYCSMREASPLQREKYNQAYNIKPKHTKSEVIYAKKKDKINKPRTNKRCKKGVIVLNSNYKKSE